MSQDYLSASAELSGLGRLCGVMMGYWFLEADLWIEHLNIAKFATRKEVQERS